MNIDRFAGNSALLVWLCPAEAGCVTDQIRVIYGGRIARLSLP